MEVFFFEIYISWSKLNKINRISYIKAMLSMQYINLQALLKKSYKTYGNFYKKKL